jgi:hypothetical protein
MQESALEQWIAQQVADYEKVYEHELEIAAPGTVLTPQQLAEVLRSFKPTWQD